jgi:hypothetical protein
MKILSLGLGVQSTWIYYSANMGLMQKFDYAIFSDTGGEKTATLKYLYDVLIPWKEKNNGTEIIICREKNLKNDLLKDRNSTSERFASIPSYIKNLDGSTGMLRRQCTNEYKIEVVEKEIRKLYGLKKHARMPKTDIIKGISLDEMSRMRNPLTKWEKYIYPYIGFWFTHSDYGRLDDDFKMSRTGIIAQYEKYKIEIPEKSSCVFCPYQSDKSWQTLKNKFPDDFADAVKIDEKIRKNSSRITGESYLHKSLQPLCDIQFTNELNDLWEGNCSSECHS